MKLSVTIMAHPSRQSFLSELLDSFDDPSRVEVVWDQVNDRWDTGRRAMLNGVGTGSTHHMVIQDDAIICRDLIAGTERALRWVPPGSPMSLYVGTSRPYGPIVNLMVDRTTDHTSWLIMKHINWGVGLVVPTNQIERMIAYSDTRNIGNYDLRLSKWFEGQPKYSRPEVWCSWPSLVDHRDSPSLIEGRNGMRQAHNFIGRDKSALDVDWSGGKIRLPRMKP